MALKYETNQYVIPRGRVFFNLQRADGTFAGEYPFGNCPGVSLTIDTEKADHYSSETGLAQKDAAVVVRIDRTGSLTCDNFSPQNFARWLSGTAARVTQAATPVVGEEITVSPGYFYQLGATPSKPLGVRNVTGVAVNNEAGTTPYEAGVDYEVDLPTGRIQILAGGAIAENTKVKVNYTPVAGSYDAVKSGGSSELTGSLRIVSDNAIGGNRDVFCPLVTLTPSGDLPLIAEGNSTDFAQMEFGLEVLKSANAEAIYVDGRPVAGV